MTRVVPKIGMTMTMDADAPDFGLHTADTGLPSATSLEISPLSSTTCLLSATPTCETGFRREPWCFPTCDEQRDAGDGRFEDDSKHAKWRSTQRQEGLLATQATPLSPDSHGAVRDCRNEDSGRIVTMPTRQSLQLVEPSTSSWVRTEQPPGAPPGSPDGGSPLHLSLSSPAPPSPLIPASIPPSIPPSSPATSARGLTSSSPKLGEASLVDLCRQLAAAEHLATKRAEELQKSVQQERALQQKVQILQQRLAAEIKRREAAEDRSAALAAERDELWERLADEEAKSQQALTRAVGFEREYDSTRQRLAAERILRVRMEEDRTSLLEQLEEAESVHEEFMRSETEAATSALARADVCAQTKLREVTLEMETLMHSRIKELTSRLEDDRFEYECHLRAGQDYLKKVEDDHNLHLTALNERLQCVQADNHISRGKIETEQNIQRQQASTIALMGRELAIAELRSQEVVENTLHIQSQIEKSEFNAIENRIVPVLNECNVRFERFQEECGRYHSQLTVEEFLYARECDQMRMAQKLLLSVEAQEAETQQRMLSQESAMLEHQMMSRTSGYTAGNLQRVLSVTESREYLATEKYVEEESRLNQYEQDEELRLEHFRERLQTSEKSYTQIIRMHEENLAKVESGSEQQRQYYAQYLSSALLEVEASAQESVMLVTELDACVDRLAREEARSSELLQCLSEVHQSPRLQNGHSLSNGGFVVADPRERSSADPSIAIQGANLLKVKSLELDKQHADLASLAHREHRGDLYAELVAAQATVARLSAQLSESGVSSPKMLPNPTAATNGVITPRPAGNAAG